MLFSLLFACLSCGPLGDEPEEPKNVPVESVSLNNESITIGAGEEYQLIPTICPESATVQDVAWSSNNESIATVSDDGIVTGIKRGIANIIVRTIDGKNRELQSYGNGKHRECYRCYTQRQ